MTPLNADAIKHLCQDKALNVHLFESINSTNQYLKELTPDAKIHICCAEHQTHGRGRFGRQWLSPFGQNIYCSIRIPFDADLHKLSGLSLITSLATLATIHEFYGASTQEIQIKWPNDLMWRTKKLSGCLIETVKEPEKATQVIIGIGINVNINTHQEPLIAALSEITGIQTDRNKLIAVLINTVQTYISQLVHHDFSIFEAEWSMHDYLKGKAIEVTQFQQSIQGTAMGVDYCGRLMLLDKEGKTHLLSTGDTSLHKKL